MTDLHKKLEAAGRKEAENLYPCGHDFKMRLSGLSSCGCCLSTLSDYRARASLHRLIQKMAEALERIRAANKPLECETKGPGDMHYWYQQELKSRDIAHEVLLELEKYLEGK